MKILARLPPGLSEGEHTIRITLTKPTPESRLIPDTVTATFTVAAGQRLGKKTLTVPIGILIPKRWIAEGTWSQYQFDEKPPRLATVRIRVSGPQIELDKLQPEDIDVYLVIEDNDRRLMKSWIQRTVRVEFRKDRDIDVSVLKVEGPLPQIEFRLTRRATPARP